MSMAEDSVATGLEIAVIGMAGRFPMAPTVDALWERLLEERECFSVFTPEELRAEGVSPAIICDPSHVPVGGIIDAADRFDAAFFGYSPREAALIDPQQRLFLETAWTALEDAGYAPGIDTGLVGVYGAVGLNDYFRRNVLAGLEPGVSGLDQQTVLASEKDFLTTRVSYKLGLEGPSVAIQTACSSSLVAVHLACQALIAGETDIALAGGVTVRLPQRQGYVFQEEGILSPDGHCRAFSHDAAGCVPGNGVAIVVLKRLSDARADDDLIHAVVRGTAVNNDGSVKLGYAAPRADGQSRVIRSALRVADVSADDIGYLEAHGTGTILGDPIEIQAATQAYRKDTRSTGYCALGSIKTNIGHLDAAAGVAGFLKAVLAVERGVIPASLHFDGPNPNLRLEDSPFYVNTESREWPSGGRRPSRRGELVWDRWDERACGDGAATRARGSSDVQDEAKLIVISGKTAGAIEQIQDNLATHLDARSDADLPRRGVYPEDRARDVPLPSGPSCLRAPRRRRAS